MAKKRKAPGTGCRRVRFKGKTRTICRNRKGKIVKSPKSKTCPTKWRGNRVSRVKGGACVAQLANGRKRFVKKVRK